MITWDLYFISLIKYEWIAETAYDFLYFTARNNFSDLKIKIEWEVWLYLT